ncbi:MAG TPA: ATP-binding cassette domain-containing protein [Solirubrobacteraceae bacterium]
MSLLELRNVSKRRSLGGRNVLLLEDASLEIDPGELVGVWGLRGSGRTTLLRLVAGIDAPDAGAVRFDGREVAGHGERILAREIGYCHKSFPGAQGQLAVDEVLLALLVNGVRGKEAHTRAHEALERAGAGRLSARRIAELNSDERVRLAIAHALALGPRLLLLDEPLAGVELDQRDALLLLLRSLADEGVAVLMTVGDLSGLRGSDQSLTIGDGRLSGSPKRGLEPVADLTLRRQASG